MEKQQSIAQPEVQQRKWPYRFVETKTEDTKHRNVMELYAFRGEFDPAELKAFCKDRKDRTAATFFFYVVVFDEVANVTFPNSPFAFEYGLEEDTIKHIRAMYVYNRVNGFSELRYSPQNIWSGPTTRVKI